MVFALKDHKKTKEQLIQEVTKLRTRIAELESRNGKSMRSEAGITGVKSRLHHLLIASPAVIYACEPRDKYATTYVSDNIREQLGYEPQDFLNDPDFWANHIHPEDAPRIFADVHLVFERNRHVHEYRFMHKDGTYRWMHDEIRLINDTDGNPLELIGYWIDINRRREMEEDLKKSQERYRSLVDSTDDSIYVLDRDYKYLFMNKKHLERMGMSGDDYIFKSYYDMHSHEETKHFVEIVNKVFITGEPVQDEYRSRRDGKYFLQTVSPVKGTDGETAGVSVISKNITPRKQMEEELRSLSLRDELTGLYNRRGFFTLAEQEIKMATRLKTGIYMLYTDVDNLKGINDRFGHREGDLALINAANILKENYRESDIVARIGGDEFAVIPVGTTEDTVDIITARLHKALDDYNKMVNRRYTLSLSAGLAYYDPAAPCSLEKLVDEADKLMYKQKRYKQAL